MLKQDTRQGRIAIFATFPLPHPQDHSPTVDIRESQVQSFREAQSGAVEGHQQSAMLEVADGAQQTGHFGKAQYDRKFLFLLGKGDVFDSPRFFQAGPIEKA